LRGRELAGSIEADQFLATGGEMQDDAVYTLGHEDVARRRQSHSAEHAGQRRFDALLERAAVQVESEQRGLVLVFRVAGFAVREPRGGGPEQASRRIGASELLAFTGVDAAAAHAGVEEAARARIVGEVLRQHVMIRDCERQR
jgi:hypothetical protein